MKGYLGVMVCQLSSRHTRSFTQDSHKLKLIRVSNVNRALTLHMSRILVMLDLAEDGFDEIADILVCLCSGVIPADSPDSFLSLEVIKRLW